MYESTTISLSGNTTELSTNFFPILIVAEDSEIALLNLQTYNSFPNINESNNRLRIIINKNKITTENSSSRHIDGVISEVANIDKSTDIFHKIKHLHEPNNHDPSLLITQGPNSDEEMLDIEIESGCYELSQINDYIKNEIKKTNRDIVFSILPNINTFRSYVYCSEAVDFTIDNSLRHVLGFDKTKLEPQILHESQRTVNINIINSIKVLCSIAQGSFNGNKPSHSVYEFYPTALHGSKLVEAPNNLIYYPLITNEINNITITLVDQDQRPLKHLGEKTTVVLHIKRYGS
ncbi:uncharacterized protein LOC126845091 [Adelges cooleyi]|uniref:uncharacterized protein LOC126845091 n=1 Tax=Adelges cooleyi TaxID=133065 RepID=UPI00217F6F47|nr:uncharacterized protein LOC126845091 [Adelges cooleyi]